MGLRHPVISMCRIALSHIAHMNKSLQSSWRQTSLPIASHSSYHVPYHACGWVMLPIWMSHVAHMNELHEWVTLHIGMSHDGERGKSYRYQMHLTRNITLIISMCRIAHSHVAHMNESWRSSWQRTSLPSAAHFNITLIILMCRIAHTEESCRTYEWVIWGGYGQ